MDGIVVLMKPAGFTSHDAVAKFRGIAHQRRIGHGGTLDPSATGVLPLFLGRATAAADRQTDTDKGYIARVKLGVTTNSYDMDGEITSRRPVEVGQEDIKAAVASFLGDSMQLPPMFSAVQVNGTRLYKLARQGVEIERERRKITVYEARVFDFFDDSFSLEIICSKGAYVRSLVNDIGEKLGCGAVLEQLTRTRAGIFTLSDAFTFEHFEELAARGELETCLIPVERVFGGYEALELLSDGRFLNGAAQHREEKDGVYRVFCGGHFLGLGRVEARELYPVKLFCERQEQ